jgi:hypothetical protein
VSFTGEITILTLRTLDQLDPPKLFGITLDYFRCAVGRSIVHNHPPHWQNCLADHGFDGLLD